MFYVITSVYNEAELIQGWLDTMQWVDHIYVIDGRFAGHAGATPLSNDGTRDIVAGYKNATLIDMSDSNVPSKLTRGFEQATTPDDICISLDTDMRIEGDVDAFKSYVNNKWWSGAVGVRIRYDNWTRHPELNGKHNILYRLIHPLGAICDPHCHGQYLRDGMQLCPTWTAPHITISHDDSGRKNERVVQSSAYFAQSEQQERDRVVNHTIRQKMRLRSHRMWYRIMHRIDRQRYPLALRHTTPGTVVK